MAAAQRSLRRLLVLAVPLLAWSVSLMIFHRLGVVDGDDFAVGECGQAKEVVASCLKV